MTRCQSFLVQVYRHPTQWRTTLTLIRSRTGRETTVTGGKRKRIEIEAEADRSPGHEFTGLVSGGQEVESCDRVEVAPEAEVGREEIRVDLEGRTTRDAEETEAEVVLERGGIATEVEAETILDGEVEAEEGAGQSAGRVHQIEVPVIAIGSKLSILVLVLQMRPVGTVRSGVNPWMKSRQSNRRQSPLQARRLHHF